MRRRTVRLVHGLRGAAVSAWPWPSSDATGKVIAAFVTALQGVEDVARTKTVNAGQMRYSYADLDAVLEAAKP